MDSKLNLIREFYCGLPKSRAKVETGRHGFAYLEELLSDGALLEYGEAHPSGLLYKYKITNISAPRMEKLLLAHIEKECNVCLYFDETANNTFCFNLDNNHKADNEALIPEIQLAATFLREHLMSIGCEPLVISSGRGYHLWCRIEVPIANQQLYSFMLRSMVLTMANLHKSGYDYNKVKANFYPDPRNNDTVSLRLFGSSHARTNLFSRILTPEGPLDEDASWAAFKYYQSHNTLSEIQFFEACKKMPHDIFSEPPPAS